MAATETVSAKPRCQRCNDALAGEELEAPTDIDGEIVCDDCYDEWFLDHSFKCPLCDERQVEDQKSDHFVLFDGYYGTPGLYKALCFPFYREPMVGYGELFADDIDRVGPVPGLAQNDGFPCAFVCKACADSRVHATEQKSPLCEKGDGA